LLAVDDEVVAIADGAGLEARKVGAGARLAITLAPDVFAAGDARQVALLLVFVAVDDERGADHAAAEAARAGIGCTVVAELLVEDHLLIDGGAESAILLRPRRRNPAALAKLRVELLR